jgi:hypothetical protein
MNIDSRLAQLEKQANVSDGSECTCPSFNTEIRTYMGAEDNQATADADKTPPKVCDVCGKPKDVIKLVLVHSREQVKAES